MGGESITVRMDKWEAALCVAWVSPEEKPGTEREICAISLL